MAKINFDEYDDVAEDTASSEPSAGAGGQPVALTQEQLEAAIVAAAAQVAAQSQPPAHQRREAPAWLSGCLVIAAIFFVVIAAAAVGSTIIAWWSGGSIYWGLMAGLVLGLLTTAVVIGAFYTMKAHYGESEDDS